MALYLARAKYSNAAFKGMVDNPQDREAAANKLFSALNEKCINSTSASAVLRSWRLWKVAQKTWLPLKWLLHQLEHLVPLRRLKSSIPSQ